MPTPHPDRQQSSRVPPTADDGVASETPDRQIAQELKLFTDALPSMISDFSIDESEELLSLLKDYTSQLSPENTQHLVSESLPCLAAHIGRQEHISPAQCRAFLTLAIQSNAILYFLPEALRSQELNVSVIHYRLEKLSESISLDKLNSVFGNQAFALATKDGPLRKVDTDRLLSVMSTAGNRADSLMKALSSLQEATQHRLPFTMLLNIFDESIRKHGLVRTLSASKVCHLILETVSPPNSDYDYYRLVLHSLSTSIKWPEEDSEHNLYYFEEIVRNAPDTPDQDWFNSVLTTLNTVPPSDVPQILKLTSEHARFPEMDTYTTYLRFVQEWHEQVDKKNLWQFLKYSAGGYSSGRMDAYKNIMSNLHRALGSMHRTSRYLSKLDDVMKGMSDEEMASLDSLSYKIDERIDKYIANDIPESKDILDIVVCLILAEGHESPWHVSVERFAQRYQERHSESLTPAYTYHSSDSTIAVSSQLGTRGRYIENPRKANFAFTLSCARKFKSGTPFMRDSAYESIFEDLGLELPGYMTRHSENFLDLIHLASRMNDGAPFKAVLEKSYPYLAEATHTHLPPVNELSVRDARGYHFLESLRVLIDDRLPVTFERLGMERKFIDKIKSLTNLKQVEAELKKYKATPPDSSWTITFSTSKNFLDSCYDLLSETCVSETCGDDFDTPEFQPLRMTVPSERWLIGTHFTAISPIQRNPSLVLLGGGPQAAAFQRMDPVEYAAMLRRECEKICSSLNLHNYCFAVGAPSKNKPFTDEGRIAQFPALRKALVPRDATLIDLTEEEYIHIPKNYGKGPIRRVAFA